MSILLLIHQACSAYEPDFQWTFTPKEASTSSLPATTPHPLIY